MVVEIPCDAEFLKQFAVVCIMHAHLDNTLKMYIRSFGDLTIEKALDDVGFAGSKVLRERVSVLAKEKLGEGEVLDLVQGYLAGCERLTDQRNELLHCIIAREREGDRFFVRKRDASWADLPKAETLAALAHDMGALIMEMNHQRINGAIALALDEASA
jgi:hypothetical protein